MASLVKLYALFLAVAALVLGNGLNGTVLGVRAVGEGMDSLTIGAIMSAYFLGFAAGSYFVPRLIETVGHIRTFAALASIASALAIAYAILVIPEVWFAIRLVYGACYAGLVIVVESWLNAATEPARRGRILAVYNIILVGAWVVSQPLLTLAPADDFVLFAITSICLSLALVPVTLSRAGGPGVVAAQRMPLSQLFHLSPLGLLGALGVGMVMSAFWGMGPVFAQRLGFDDSGTALFMAVTMAGALLFNWPLGRLSDEVDRRAVIVGTALVAALAACVIAFVGDRPGWTLLISSFVFGGMAIPIYSLCVAHVNDRLDEGQLIGAATQLVLIYGLGAAIGPFLASAVMAVVGPSGLFYFSAAGLGALAVVGAARISIRDRVARQDKQGFIVVPRTTHAALQMHRHRGNGGPDKRAKA